MARHVQNVDRFEEEEQCSFRGRRRGYGYGGCLKSSEIIYVAIPLLPQSANKLYRIRNANPFAITDRARTEELQQKRWGLFI